MHTIVIQSFPWSSTWPTCSPSSKPSQSALKLLHVLPCPSTFTSFSRRMSFGQPLSDLRFSVMITRMGAQNLRRSRLSTFLHACPEFHRRFWTIAGLRCHQQSNVVSFGFVFAASGHGEEKLQNHVGAVERDVEGKGGKDRD